MSAQPGSREELLREIVDAYAALPEGPERDAAWEAVVECHGAMVVSFILSEITAGRLLRPGSGWPAPETRQ
jgi:hypothetical protein